MMISFEYEARDVEYVCTNCNVGRRYPSGLRRVAVNQAHIISVGQVVDGGWRLVTVCGSWYPLTESEAHRVLGKLREFLESTGDGS